MKKRRFPLTAKLTLSVLGLMLCLWLAAGAVLVVSTAREIIDGSYDQMSLTAQKLNREWDIRNWTEKQDDLEKRVNQALTIHQAFRPNQNLDNRYVGYYVLSRLNGVNEPQRILVESYPGILCTKAVDGTFDIRFLVLKGMSGRELWELWKVIQDGNNELPLEARGVSYGDKYFYPNTLTIGGKTYTVPGAPEGDREYTLSEKDMEECRRLLEGLNTTSPSYSMQPFLTDPVQWELLADAASRVHTTGCFDLGDVEEGAHPPRVSQYLRDVRSWYVHVPQPDGTSLYLSGLIACAPLRTALEENAATLLKLLVLLLALGAGTALITVRVVVRPLQRTAAEAGKVAALDFDDFRPDTARRDELGDLNRALKSMSEDLRRRWDGERALERRRQDFVAAASHDLKTPLALIRGYAEAVEQSIDPAENARYLASIQREADKMDKLVLDLLDATRLQRLEALERTEPVALDALLRALLEEMAPALAGRRVETHLAPVQFTGDPELLKRALGNVLSNAARYTPPRR